MVWASGQSLKGGEYIIEKVLGEGGFAVTYLAKKRNDEKVVIKTLIKEELQNRPEIAKIQNYFVNEAARILLLKHPHIVRIYELFYDDAIQQSCIVMEYIEGKNLQEILNEKGEKGVFLETEALSLILQIGEAVTALHQQNLLHRDIKPQNIIVRSNSSEAVLIDFGIAREYDPNQPNNNIDFLSPGYAPIEQHDRRQREGYYTDVYALAATLYFMLTRTVPPSASQRNSESKKLFKKDPLLPPIELQPTISEYVNKAITEGMNLKSKNRPQSVDKWLEKLRQPILISETSDTSKTIVVSPGNQEPNYEQQKQFTESYKSIIIILCSLTIVSGAFSIWWIWFRPVPPNVLEFTINSVYDAELQEPIILKEALVCDNNGGDDIVKVNFWLRVKGTEKELRPEATPRRIDEKCATFSYEIVQKFKPDSYELIAKAYDKNNQQSEERNKFFKINAKPRNLRFSTKNIYNVGETINLTSGSICDENSAEDVEKIDFNLSNNNRNIKKFSLFKSQDFSFSASQNSVVCKSLSFTYSIGKLTAGIYKLTGFATDNSQGKSQEFNQTFTVNATPRNVSFTWDKSTYNVGEKLTITSTSICDDNGWDDIKEVFFYYKLENSNNWENFGSIYSSLKQNSNDHLCAISESSFTVDLTSPGNYELKAIGYDKQSKTSESAIQKFTVIEPSTPSITITDEF